MPSKMSHAMQTVAMAICALLITTASADEILDQAKSFIDGKQPQVAYGMLKPLEDDRAGDPNFDYLLGLSAPPRLIEFGTAVRTRQWAGAGRTGARLFSPG